MPNIKFPIRYEYYDERMYKTPLDRLSIKYILCFEWNRPWFHLTTQFTLYTLNTMANYAANDKPFQLQIVWIE